MRINASEAKDRYDLAEKTFDGVMRAVEHLDGKASRILAAIAFLTAAAAAVFGRAASPYPPASEVARRLAPELNQYLQGQDSEAVARSIAATLTTPHLLLFGYDASVVLFLMYIVLILLGSAFYLVAIGPHLQLAAFPSEEGKVRSLLFFNYIGQVTQGKWRKHWKTSNVKQLRREMSGDFVFESWVLSDKLRTKESLMSIGSFFFRSALICLGLLAISLLVGDIVLLTKLFLLISFIFCTIYIGLDYWRESKQFTGRTLAWIAVLGVLLFVGFCGLVPSPRVLLQ